MVCVHFVYSLFFNLKLNKQKQECGFFYFYKKREEILAGIVFFLGGGGFMGRKRINDFNKCFPFVSGHDTPLSADWSTKSEPVTSSSVVQQITSPLLLYGAGLGLSSVLFSCARR